MTPRRKNENHDDGSVTVEMVVLAVPIAVIMTLVLVAGVRLVGTQIDLTSAAAVAARAASLTASSDGARAAATEAAAANLADHDRTCDPMTVTVDTTEFRPGGSVAVTIGCALHTTDLIGLGLPGELNGHATARAVIDSHRDVTGGPA